MAIGSQTLSVPLLTLHQSQNQENGPLLMFLLSSHQVNKMHERDGLYDVLIPLLTDLAFDLSALIVISLETIN